MYTYIYIYMFFLLNNVVLIRATCECSRGDRFVSAFSVLVHASRLWQSLLCWPALSRPSLSRPSLTRPSLYSPSQWWPLLWWPSLCCLSWCWPSSEFRQNFDGFSSTETDYRSILGSEIVSKLPIASLLRYPWGLRETLKLNIKSLIQDPTYDQ